MRAIRLLSIGATIGVLVTALPIKLDPMSSSNPVHSSLKMDPNIPEHAPSSEISEDDRRIRSFIRRQGRLTVGQSRALESLWPLYGLEPGHALDQQAVFGRKAPLILEIGYGNGDSLVTMASKTPESDFIGIEVHRPGVGHLLLKIEEQDVKNLRTYCADAIEILMQEIADGSLDRVQLFFPDPWHKTRHHKRRIVNEVFLDLLSQKLKPGGLFHAATDWEPYAEHMAETLEAHPQFVSIQSSSPYSERPAYRPETKFERRGHRLGHGVWDLLYQNQKSA